MKYVCFVYNAGSGERQKPRTNFGENDRNIRKSNEFPTFLFLFWIEDEVTDCCGPCVLKISNFLYTTGRGDEKWVYFFCSSCFVNLEFFIHLGCTDRKWGSPFFFLFLLKILMFSLHCRPPQRRLHWPRQLLSTPAQKYQSVTRGIHLLCFPPIVTVSSWYLLGLLTTFFLTIDPVCVWWVWIFQTYIQKTLTLSGWMRYKQSFRKWECMECR